MLKFLISGFEPFGGDTVNPTAALVQALEHEAVEGLYSKPCCCLCILMNVQIC